MKLLLCKNKMSTVNPIVLEMEVQKILYMQERLQKEIETINATLNSINAQIGRSAQPVVAQTIQTIPQNG